MAHRGFDDRLLFEETAPKSGARERAFGICGGGAGPVGMAPRQRNTGILIALVPEYYFRNLL